MSASGVQNVGSTSIEPISEVRREIEELFRWNPPRLHSRALLPGKEASTNTSPPVSYDQHFEDRFGV
jgi:hypothetical protein